MKKQHKPQLFFFFFYFLSVSSTDHQHQMFARASRSLVRRFYSVAVREEEAFLEFGLEGQPKGFPSKQQQHTSVNTAVSSFNPLSSLFWTTLFFCLMSLFFSVCVAVCCGAVICADGALPQCMHGRTVHMHHSNHYHR